MQGFALSRTLQSCPSGSQGRTQTRCSGFIEAKIFLLYWLVAIFCSDTLSDIMVVQSLIAFPVNCLLRLLKHAFQITTTFFRCIN